jgi:hypothetical protein
MQNESHCGRMTSYPEITTSSAISKKYEQRVLFFGCLARQFHPGAATA